MKRFIVLTSFFLFFILQIQALFAQSGIRSVSCGEAVVEFENTEAEEVTLTLYTKSADDTLIFMEDFSCFPAVALGNQICDATQLLPLPNSYTRHSACFAKRLYSPNGDTCFLNQNGEFVTPLIDFSKYGNPIRISFFLKTESLYQCVFSLHSVDQTGNQTLLAQIPLTKGASYHFDSVFSLSPNSVRFRFSTTNFVAMDDLTVSSSNIASFVEQTVTTTADTCAFSSLKADTKYYCAFSNSSNELSFRTSKALELAEVENISPYGAEVSLIACAEVEDCRYVLRRLSDQNTVYAEDLFFSQVASTDSYNRAIEIYNGTGRDICLQDYKLVVDIHSGNGNYSSTKTLAFSQRDTIKSDSCIVIAQSLHALQNAGNGAYYVNPSIIGTVVIDGNDPFALIRGNDTVDLFGNFAESISNSQGWTAEGVRTAKTVLQRKSWVSKGIKSNLQSGFPTLGNQWLQLGNVSDTEPGNFSDFGLHQMQGALSGECLDSVVVSFDMATDILRLNGLNDHTTYEIYALASQNGETVKSNSRIFRTGKITHRTQSGDWSDVFWSNGAPSSIDEAVICNGQSLTINQGDTVQCYRLTIRDTSGCNRASVFEYGQLVCQDGVLLEMKLHNDLQNSDFYQLFGFPVDLSCANSDSIRSLVGANPQIEIFNLPSEGDFSQGQAYLLKFLQDNTLVFKGKLNNQPTISLLCENSFGLSANQSQTAFTYNPYPFPVTVSQLLSQEVSLPQVLNPQTLNFVPLCPNDTLAAFEGFLVERFSSSSLLMLNSQPVSPLPVSQNERLTLRLETSTLSDEVNVDFFTQTPQGINQLGNQHKFSISQNPFSIALNEQTERYCSRILPEFEDSIYLNLDLQLPTLDTYSLSCDLADLEGCLGARLFDMESGMLLFDFMQGGVYSFVSAQGERHLQLRLYKTLSGLEQMADKGGVVLKQDGRVLRLESQSRIEQMELFDMGGRVLEIINSNREIILPSLGTFLLRVRTKEGISSFKVTALH